MIGVHSYGGCPNSAPRFTTQMISRFMRRMNVIKTLRSVHTPRIYVRCDGSGVDRPEPSGGGVVNCQYEPPGSLERFCIFPRTIAPSLATQETLHRTVIESKNKENVFVRMDGKGMDAPQGSGGGVVNCQFGAGSLETYFIKEEDAGGVYSIVSAANTHLRIRVNGTGMGGSSPSGGGEVNCQYYGNIDDPAMSLETIRILDA